MKESLGPVKAQNVPTVTNKEGLRQTGSTQKGMFIWKHQPNYRAPCISWHNISRVMWHLNATLASSQSFKKWETLSPGPYNPMTCSASLHALSSRESLEETVSSSDQASPSLSHIGLVGQPNFHASPRSGAWHPSSPPLPSSAMKCRAISAHFLRTSAEKKGGRGRGGVRMSALKKGLNVSVRGIVAGSFFIRKKKSSPCGPYFPGTFHSTDAVRKHTLSVGSK